jgi:hypothetical protein
VITWQDAHSAVASEWRRAPYLAQLGVTVIALGTLGDVVAHTVVPSASQGFTVPQQTAHLVILLGMVLTILGVALGGRRTTRGVRHFKEVDRVSRHR